MMNDAEAIEDSIYALSQPPYPPIPAHELYGDLLMDMNRLAEPRRIFSVFGADTQASQGDLWTGPCGGGAGRNKNRGKGLRRIPCDLEECRSDSARNRCSKKICDFRRH